MSYSVWIFSKGLYSCDEARETYNQSDRCLSNQDETVSLCTHCHGDNIFVSKPLIYPYAVRSVLNALRAAEPTAFLSVMGQTHTVIVTADNRHGIVVEIITAAV